MNKTEWSFAIVLGIILGAFLAAIFWMLVYPYFIGVMLAK